MQTTAVNIFAFPASYYSVLSTISLICVDSHVGGFLPLMYDAITIHYHKSYYSIRCRVYYTPDRCYVTIEVNKLHREALLPVPTLYSFCVTIYGSIKINLEITNGKK